MRSPRDIENSRHFPLPFTRVWKQCTKTQEIRLKGSLCLASVYTLSIHLLIDPFINPSMLAKGWETNLDLAESGRKVLQNAGVTFVTFVRPEIAVKWRSLSQWISGRGAVRLSTCLNRNRVETHPIWTLELRVAWRRLRSSSSRAIACITWRNLHAGGHFQ